MHPHDLSPGVLRIPPHSSDSEDALLGGLLLSDEHWESVLEVVSEDDFFGAARRLIFGVARSLADAGQPVNVITVHEELVRRGKADEAGGLVYVNSLAQYVPSAANMRSYAEIVRDKALMRRVIAASDEAAAKAYHPAGDTAGAILDGAIGKLQALQLRGTRSKPVGIESLVAPFLDHLSALEAGQVTSGIPTHIPALDRMLGGGIRPGKQIIVAARPSVGKSSFAQQLCLNLARDGHACAILSQEMGNDELVARAAANLGRVSLDGVTTGKMDNDSWSRLTEGVELMRDLPLFLDDQSALTLGDISAKARMLKRQHDVKVIVIDYLQLCASGKTTESRHHQLEELSRGIKNLAKSLDLSFITLSQLNREVEKRVSGRPVLSDLKESGAIEEDADVVILLSRHGDNREGPRQIVCDMPKNRQGRCGDFGLIFEGEYQRWSESAEPFHQKSDRAPTKRYAEDF